MHLSPMHIAVVVIVIILIFGAPKLPMLARSLGQSLKIFKSEVKDLRDGDDEEKRTTEPGELGRETNQAAPRTTPPTTETPSTEPTAPGSQDPQSREK